MRYFKTFLISVFLMILSFLASSPAWAWWNGNYVFSEELIIDPSQVDVNLYGFPVKICINSTVFTGNLHGTLNNQSWDIAFVNSDNSSQYYWTHEMIDKENGVFYVYVNVSKVSASDNTVIYMYYNNSHLTGYDSYHVGENDSSGLVFDRNFIFVNDGRSNNLTLYDHSVHDNNGVKKAASEPVLKQYFDTAGGYIQDYDGDNDYIEINGGAADSSLNATNITISIWMKPDSLGEDSNGTILSKGFTNGWYLGVYGKYKQFLYSTLIDSKSSMNTVVNNTWSMQQITYNGVDVKHYKNSTLMDTTNDASGLTQLGNKIVIGARNISGDFAYCNFIDEMRISNVIRNSSWLNAEYNNFNNFTVDDTDSFITFSGVYKNNSTSMLHIGYDIYESSGIWSLSNIGIILLAVLCIVIVGAFILSYLNIFQGSKINMSNKKILSIVVTIFISSAILLVILSFMFSLGHQSESFSISDDTVDQHCSLSYLPVSNSILVRKNIGGTWYTVSGSYITVNGLTITVATSGL